MYPKLSSMILMVRAYNTVYCKYIYIYILTIGCHLSCRNLQNVLFWLWETLDFLERIQRQGTQHRLQPATLKFSNTSSRWLLRFTLPYPVQARAFMHKQCARGAGKPELKELLVLLGFWGKVPVKIITPPFRIEMNWSVVCFYSRMGP